MAEYLVGDVIHGYTKLKINIIKMQDNEIKKALLGIAHDEDYTNTAKASAKISGFLNATDKVLAEIEKIEGPMKKRVREHIALRSVQNK